MKMKLAVFDIDGTLTRTDDVDSVCFVRAMSDAHALGDINTDWAGYPHTTDSGITLHIFRERFGRAPHNDELRSLQARFTSLLRDHYEHDAARFRQIPGAAVMLDKLASDSSWAVALATGCWRASASLKLEAAGIPFEHLPAAFAEDGISREEIVQTAIRRALAHYARDNFTRIVSIGDGLWDVRTAARLNLPFLAIADWQYAPRLLSAGATHAIPDYTNIELFTHALDAAQVPHCDRTSRI